ncbi:cupin-like domain-containing protein [Sphingomonas psychrotolerans]|uniref:Cupin-like domain-containing protein n=1 Tax=Sphingomonas psychrotolerans TaxID=1327635 RepID=A0ABU3MZR3_9SPHN|nr:cupin-like domain-containing protein [Sphingomonas psychrotolerans]MDT8757717.1 cupin-like domain-containing protein [Sphingomonas psychrotolerans]
MREIPSGGKFDSDSFRREVAEDCAPVVLRALGRGWPLVAAGQESRDALIAYLQRFDIGRTAQAFVGPPAIAGRYHYGTGPDGFNFARETLSLAETLRRIAAAADRPELPSIYMGSVPADIHLPGLADENGVGFLPSAVRPRIWIGNASRVACHYDTYDNLALVAAGHRRFTLYPPDAIADLYVGPIDHTMAGQPVSLAAECAEADPRFPRFEATRPRALEVELEAGDALYIPKLWWHQVEASGSVNVLVNYWWDAFSAGPDAPYTTMMLAMIAIAERPAAERAAWRAFFDHYVFRPDGHPLAHLPEERHGILGPLRSNYGRIRAMVMQALRGG